MKKAQAPFHLFKTVYPQENMVYAESPNEVPSAKRRAAPSHERRAIPSPLLFQAITARVVLVLSATKKGTQKWVPFFT